MCCCSSVSSGRDWGLLDSVGCSRGVFKMVVSVGAAMLYYGACCMVALSVWFLERQDLLLLHFSKKKENKEKTVLKSLIDLLFPCDATKDADKTEKAFWEQQLSTDRLIRGAVTGWTFLWEMGQKSVTNSVSSCTYNWNKQNTQRLHARSNSRRRQI